MVYSEYSMKLTFKINTLEDAKNARNREHDITFYGQLKNRLTLKYAHIMNSYPLRANFTTTTTTTTATVVALRGQ